MTTKPNIKLYSFTLDCKDPHDLAGFYAELLGWEIVPIPEDEYVVIAPPGSGYGSYPGVTFQRNPDYQPPVWPDRPDAQRQMAHLDFAVEDVDAAAQYAMECGATVSEQQFSEYWKVLFDPAGHPFCLCDGKVVFASEGFALR